MKALAFRGSWLVLVACAAPAQPVSTPNPPDVVSVQPPPRDEPARAVAPEKTERARAPTPALERARGQPEPTTGSAHSQYHREDWPHWIDADGDCQDTRTEVLLAEAEPGSVVFDDVRRCKIASGRWRCPYTDRVITDPHELDVDHLVPLAHAHAAGGMTWSPARRTAFANDLGDAHHLVAVVAGANRAKGARSIVSWLPPDVAARCEYVDAWRAITARWSLRMTSVEATTAAAYAADCREGRTPRLASETNARATPDAAEPRGTCCKVCSTGKPCGDGCIAQAKTCHKPPGCAC